MPKEPTFRQGQPGGPATCVFTQSPSPRPWRLVECISVAILKFSITFERQTPRFHLAQIRSLVRSFGELGEEPPLITEAELPSRRAVRVPLNWMIGPKGNETVFLVPEYGGGAQLIPVLRSEVPPDAQETRYFPSDHAKQSQQKCKGLQS